MRGAPKKSFLDNRMAIDRLKADYEKYKDLIVGCDFDDVLFDLHDADLDLKPIIDLMLRCQKIGLTTCLWSAVPDEWSIKYKVRICEDMGLKFKYINESPAINQSRKPHFNILLDDRAGLSSAFYILETTLNELGL